MPIKIPVQVPILIVQCKNNGITKIAVINNPKIDKSIFAIFISISSYIQPRLRRTNIQSVSVTDENNVVITMTFDVKSASLSIFFAII